MSRGLIHGVLIAAVIGIAVPQPRAAGPKDAKAMRTAAVGQPLILQRFLSIDDPLLTQYRALRRLEAQSENFDKSAWMDVWTEADAAGFRYEVVAEGGSDYIRGRVFLATLQAEQKMWTPGTPNRAALTPDNYVFEDRGAESDGLASLAVTPRRKDMLLVHGAIFLNPADGDLVRIEGRLSKSPSFWTRQVEIVRRYQRLVGIRMPIAMDSVANVRVAGKSTFRMSYEYESVNNQPVGSPQPRTLTARAARPSQ